MIADHTPARPGRSADDGKLTHARPEPGALEKKTHWRALSVALVMGVVVSAGAGATIPFGKAGPEQVREPATASAGVVPPGRGVPIVALINHSTEADRLFLGQFCGGVLVAPTSVITATHCLHGRTASAVDVVSGVIDLCHPPAAPDQRRSAVLSMSVVDGSAGTLTSLSLATPVEKSALPHPDPLVPAEALAGIGAQVTGWGWGRNGLGGTPSCTLRPVELTVVAPERCRHIVDETFSGTAADAGASASILCTVPSNGVNTCTGDSGGPVVAAGRGTRQLLAITMAGEGCGPESPGLAVRPQGSRWIH